MILTSIVMTVCVAVEPVRVERWSSERSIVGEPVSLGPQGIDVRVEGSGMPIEIPWYDLRSIEPAMPEINAYQQQAIDAWRAHARRKRGDLAGALPIYESLSDSYLWSVGAQSEDVSLGLVQCLLDAGRRDEAVMPMLSWFVAAGLHTPIGSPIVPMIDKMIDNQTLLLTALPPVFLGDRSRDMPSEPPDPALLTARERVLFALYVMVLAQQTRIDQQGVDEIEQLKQSMRAKDAGIVLVEQMVFAQVHPDASRRQAAREALTRRARTQRNTWIEVWARLGLGASLLREPAFGEQERGVIELLHIVTRLSSVDAGLTMLAAEIANTHLASTGRAQWGQQILYDARANLMNGYAAASAPAQEILDDD